MCASPSSGGSGRSGAPIDSGGPGGSGGSIDSGGHGGSGGPGGFGKKCSWGWLASALVSLFYMEGLVVLLSLVGLMVLVSLLVLVRWLFPSDQYVTA